MKNSSFLRSGRPSKAASNAFSEICKIEPEREAFIKIKVRRARKRTEISQKKQMFGDFWRGSALGEVFF